MIDPDMRNAVYQLHRVGRPLREISRQFSISRNTVRQIIRQQGAMPQTVRKDKIQIDPDLLRSLYHECGGWVQRVHEKLLEEQGVTVSYSTLTRLLRELGLGKTQQTRCDRVPDEPGAEMQHDTTVYRVKLSGQETKVIASMLYLRYSKRRYLKFYRRFNRFTMKCFLHEALMHWGYAAGQCIIDNTNLARLRGSGSQAVIVPEMVAFAQRCGFEFVCHALGHANRKAGEERSFWTAESNFLPGRRFESLEDLNRQAFEWATVRMHHRPVGKAGLIPAQAFEHERQYLVKLPPLPPPYLPHQRATDQYGYIAFQGNYYWVPGAKREVVKLLEYADCLKIFQGRTCVAEYPLPPEGVKSAHYSPEGQPRPRHLPKHRKNGSQQEEQRLRALDPEVAAYVDYALSCLGLQRHRFLRDLFALSRRVTPAVFVRAVARARRYRVVDLLSLERIVWLCMSQQEPTLPQADVDDRFRERPTYLEGHLTDEPDLSIYDRPADDEEESEGEQHRSHDDTPDEPQPPESEDLDG
jgi:transposase